MDKLTRRANLNPIKLFASSLMVPIILDTFQMAAFKDRALSPIYRARFLTKATGKMVYRMDKGKKRLELKNMTNM